MTIFLSHRCGSRAALVDGNAICQSARPRNSHTHAQCQRKAYPSQAENNRARLPISARTLRKYLGSQRITAHAQLLCWNTLAKSICPHERPVWDIALIPHVCRRASKIAVSSNDSREPFLHQKETLRDKTPSPFLPRERVLFAPPTFPSDRARPFLHIALTRDFRRTAPLTHYQSFFEMFLDLLRPEYSSTRAPALLGRSLHHRLLASSG